jgi:hypothetical protein
MVAPATALLAAPGKISRRFEITMNLPKSKTHSARSQYGLDVTSVSSRRRSIFLDIPFHRTR